MKGHPVGSKVVIVRSHNPLRIGQVATVVSEPQAHHPVQGTPWFGKIEHGELMQRLDLIATSPGCTHVAYPPSYLEPLPDDSSSKSTWSSLPDWARNLFKIREGA